jgi:hypothetical protein
MAAGGSGDVDHFEARGHDEGALRAAARRIGVRTD